MKKQTRKSVLKAAVIAAMVIIPVLYSYFYLGAFWDPYSRLEELPVAVVNEDKGSIVNGEQRNLGQEMCKKLEDSNELKFIFTDEDKAKEGTGESEYYAMIIIPADFSENIASSETNDKHTATITFSPNEKRNYLAGQILNRAVLEVEESVRGTIASEIVGKLADTIQEVPDQMLKLQDGLKELQEGSEQLEDGSASLKEGTKSFDESFGRYQQGVAALKEGSDTLTAGSSSLDSGIQQLLEGADKLSASTKNLDQLSVGAKSLASAAGQLNTGLIQYTDGVDALISSVGTTTAFLENYVTSVNPDILKEPVFAAFVTKLNAGRNEDSLVKLQSASQSLKEASKLISSGAQQLSDGSQKLPQLQQAIMTLTEGLKSAKEGSAQLAAGSKELSEGLNSVNTATAALSDAAGKIADGAVNLSDGTSQLKTGIDTAEAGVSDAVTDTDRQLDALDGLAEYAEAPVTVETDLINPVPNYGTAFAPYFMSLSLFVGALIMFVVIYMDADGKFQILSRTSEHKLARSFLYLLIGLVQALVLAVVLQASLGLEVNNRFLYYISCCLVSMVFISIVQFLMIHLKDVGKFLSILLLILQLTSCGGTFPMELVPKMFNVLYPFMPMTYSVGLFKEAISGEASGNAAYNAVVLLVILAVFMTLTILFSGIKAKGAKKATE